jgi:adenine phosphoribosyltransferase
VTDYLRLIDNHTQGPRNDVTPLFADSVAFMALIDDLSRQIKEVEFDLVAAIDALGFILGTALALRHAVGLVTLRKGGKLPVDTETVTFTDYSGQVKQLELRKDVIRLGARVLIVDEWIETGTQVRAAAQLIERQGGVVVGIAVIHADLNARTRPLFERYPCFALRYEE